MRNFLIAECGHRTRSTGNRWIGLWILPFLVFESTWVHGDSPLPMEIEWGGLGKHRVLVQIPPRDLGAREFDEYPVELEIDWEEITRTLKLAQRADLGSLQVIRHDAETGRVVPGVPFEGRGPSDVPLRWYDASIPYEFPEFNESIDRTKGVVRTKPMTRGGYFYNAQGEWKAGKLVWLHRQDRRDNRSSLYAIYFDTTDAESLVSLPPAGWIGDGTPRCEPKGTSTMGGSHVRVDLHDWNQDGRMDLIVGEHSGHVFWWPNVGTKTQPEYRYGHFLFADGQPIDAGLAASPKMTDWDGDGDADLLVGTHYNRLVFYRNTGSDAAPRLTFVGPVTIDGEPLEAPIRPLERGSPSIFVRDYYPVPEVVDWDADGDLDLLLGGYITGLIFWYERTASHPDGTPILELRGPLQADDANLNVQYWCAAPCAVDIDRDGDLDLFSGNMPQYMKPEEAAWHERSHLQFFLNQGRAGSPRLTRSELPGKGDLPPARLATPRAADLDADGDLDLAVGAGTNIYLFMNEGNAREPKFAFHRQPIEATWGLAAISPTQFRDWNGDGRTDLIDAYTVRLRDESPNPYRWPQGVGVLPKGVHISHPSGIGDDWFWPYLDDFDQDGRLDVLFGDWGGHVWFHQNQSDAEQSRFDVTGYRFKLIDERLLRVGPIGQDPSQSFDAMQGARTVFTVADFDRDGDRDLVVGDNYGHFYYFAQQVPIRQGQEPRFSAGIRIADLGIRGLVETTDWNQDGYPDLIASAANGRVELILNQAPSSPNLFASPQPFPLPPIPQPRTMVVDLNGDGDEDLFIPSTQGACFIERSFLEHGYGAAKMLRFETRAALR